MFFVVVLLSLAALVALAGLSQFWGTRADARKFPPPGRIIDVGGTRLHARVTGNGTPVVVFESGISASSINWTQLEQKVAAFTTACCYDRAGLGWSGSPRGDFNADRMVSDLASLLERLNLPGPYVLVGHSYGGLLVRLFAERYPERAAALVLIDPVLRATGRSRRGAARMKQRGARLAGWCEGLARLGMIRLATSPVVVRRFILPRLAAGKSEPTEGAVYRLDSELRSCLRRRCR